LDEGQELRITKQYQLPYAIKPFHDEVLCDVTPLSVSDALFGKPFPPDKHGSYH
jgi:hypothetical protein